MEKFLHKILSFSLAFIVLLSSFSFTINKHVCGGKITNITLFASADTCDMEIDTCNKNKEETSIQKEPCCKDISQIIQGKDNNQQAQQFNLNIQQIQFIQAFVYSFIVKFQKTTNISTNVHYSPPLVYKNVQILF